MTGPYRMTGPAPDAEPTIEPVEPPPVVEPGPEVSPDDGDEDVPEEETGHLGTFSEDGA